MSDRERYRDREKEAAGSKRRNRWDRPVADDRDSRRPDRETTELKRNDDKRADYDQRYGEQGQGNSYSGSSSHSTSRSRDRDRDRDQDDKPARRKFTEEEDASKSNDQGLSVGRIEHQDGESTTYKYNSDTDFRQYEQQLQSMAAAVSEAPKRDHAAAFSPTDSEPYNPTDEPLPKKMGFVSMSFGAKRSGGAELASASSKPKGFMSTFEVKKPLAPIKMALGVQKPKAPPTIKKPPAVASIFNEDDESDEEEMPPEAKMRMRNLGRETPTAAGPNSFGKGNLGFCDRHKIIQRELQKKMDELGPKK